VGAIWGSVYSSRLWGNRYLYLSVGPACDSNAVTVHVVTVVKEAWVLDSRQSLKAESPGWTSETESFKNSEGQVFQVTKASVEKSQASRDHQCRKLV